MSWHSIDPLFHFLDWVLQSIVSVTDLLKEKLFSPIDHFYCFHCYYFISLMSTCILISLLFSLDFFF